MQLTSTVHLAVSLLTLLLGVNGQVFSAKSGETYEIYIVEPEGDEVFPFSDFLTVKWWGDHERLVKDHPPVEDLGICLQEDVAYVDGKVNRGFCSGISCAYVRSVF
jgi:hypothetical protein